MRSSSLSSATMQGSQNGPHWMNSLTAARTTTSPRMGLSESDPSHLSFGFGRDEGSERHSFVVQLGMDEGSKLGDDDPSVNGLLSPRINLTDDPIELSRLTSVGPLRRFHMDQEEAESPKVASRQSSKRRDIFENESEKRLCLSSDFNVRRRSNSLDKMIPNRDPIKSGSTSMTSSLHSDADSDDEEDDDDDDDEDDDDKDSILSFFDVHLDEKDFDVSSIEELDRPNVPSSSSSGAMQSSSSSSLAVQATRTNKYLLRRPQLARFSMQSSRPVRQPLASSSSRGTAAAGAAASSCRNSAGAASSTSRHGKTVRSNGVVQSKRQKTGRASAYAASSSYHDSAGAASPSVHNGKTLRSNGGVDLKPQKGQPGTTIPIQALVTMEKPKRKKSSRAAVIPEPPVGMSQEWCQPPGNHGRPRKVDTEQDDNISCRDNRCGEKYASHVEARACEFSHVLWQYGQVPLNDLTCHVVGWKEKTTMCTTQCKTLKTARDHFNKVHGYRSEACPVCRKRFREPNLLRDHLKAAITRYNVARGIFVPAPAPVDGEPQPDQPHQPDDDQSRPEPAVPKPRKKRQNAKDIQAGIEEERRERQKKKQDGDEGRRWRLLRREGLAVDPVPSQQVSEGGRTGKPSTTSEDDGPSNQKSPDETR